MDTIFVQGNKHRFLLVHSLTIEFGISLHFPWAALLFHARTKFVMDFSMCKKAGGTGFFINDPSIGCGFNCSHVRHCLHEIITGFRPAYQRNLLHEHAG